MHHLRSCHTIAAAAAASAITLSGVLSAAAPGTAAAQASVPGPVVKLIAAQDSLTLPRFGTTVFLDPGIWVASLGSALRLDVQRASYSQPVIITQIINTPSGDRFRPLPTSVLDGWKGLRDFIRLTVRSNSGRSCLQSADLLPQLY